MALKLAELVTKETESKTALAACRAEAEELTEEHREQEQTLLQDQEQLNDLEYRIELNQEQIAQINEQINHTMQTLGLIEERLKHNLDSRAEKLSYLRIMRSRLKSCLLSLNSSSMILS